MPVLVIASECLFSARLGPLLGDPQRLTICSCHLLQLQVLPFTSARLYTPTFTESPRPPPLRPTLEPPSPGSPTPYPTPGNRPLEPAPAPAPISPRSSVPLLLLSSRSSLRHLPYYSPPLQEHTTTTPCLFSARPAPPISSSYFNIFSSSHLLLQDYR